MKIPTNWQQEYSPIAAPLLFSGAILETIEGSQASSKVKAVKNNKKASVKKKGWLEDIEKRICPNNNAQQAR